MVKKKTTKRFYKPRTNKAEEVIPAGLKLLKIETGIPLPARGIRDPEFYNSVVEVLKTIKPKQSFVIKKSKVHFTMNVVKKEFEEYKMRTSMILPNKAFSRIWRIA